MNPSPINFIDETAQIGNGTVVWHFAVVMQGVVVGTDCSIGSCAEIGKGSVIGNHTRIGHGVFLPYYSQVGCRVFIAPGVYCADDKFPKVNNPGYIAEPPVIEDDVSIGMGAVLLPGVRIGAGALIAAGAIVTKDVPPNGFVRGEPSRLRVPAERKREAFV